MSNPFAREYDYVIVGGGAIGTSTAYYLSQVTSSIIVLDQGYSGAASRDINKIVRFDYTDAFYMDLAQEAMSEWKSSPLFKGYVHPTGRVSLFDDEGRLSSIRKNHERNGLSVLEDLTPSDLTIKTGGSVRYPEILKPGVVFNPLDVWVNYPNSVTAMRERAKLRGVDFIEDEVEKLIFNRNSRCSGIKTRDGIISCSRKVVVATGAWTEKLLTKSLSPRSVSGQVNGAFDISNSNVTNWPLATGICVVHFPLDGENLERFKKIPIISYLGRGEILPPTADGTLKMSIVKPFTNVDSNLSISIPVDSKDIELPHSLKADAQEFINLICPILSQHERTIKLYWDGFTKTQDPIIDTIADNVVLAIGGSYHMAKFLPIIGRYVVAEIHGELSEPYKSRWAISSIKSGELKDQPYLWPTRDLHDLS